ncbi:MULTISPECIES: sugar transferase [Micromonospora]|nr:MULTISPECIES: sugar transferase [unclassified Micromonospora]
MTARHRAADHVAYDRVKRAMDVVVAGLLLVATAPVMLFVATAILVGTGRPVLFRQHRPGRHGALFTLVKFRTMRPSGRMSVDPRDDGDRLTPLGRWLRATSLDELPTLWNVLRGDMSLVGPRPLLPQYLDRYSPREARRHEVRPGVTGLAQVRGRNELDWTARFEYDVWYVDHRSLHLDLRILGETAVAVFRRTGISAPDAPTAHEFVRVPAGHAAGAGGSDRSEERVA